MPAHTWLKTSHCRFKSLLALLLPHGVLDLHLAHALLLKRILHLYGLRLHRHRIRQFKPFDL
jgi:hypothetical protein